MDTGYELEMAYRKMSEYQQEADHDGLVKKLKEGQRKQRVSFWNRLISLIKWGKRPIRPSLKSDYGK